MKAAVQIDYGSADVLEFKEIDKPVANDDDVLVRVQCGIPCRRPTLDKRIRTTTTARTGDP
jgi:hypothetical protein